MRFELKAGTTVFVGNAPATLPADTEVDFEAAQNFDQLAEALAATSPTVYAAHRDALAHEEEAERDIDGERRQVRVSVSYGVGGARVEQVLAPAFEEAEVEASLPAQPEAGDTV